MRKNKNFSQFGEDKVLRWLTQIFWFTPRMIIDIGANDGWSWSNSRSLILSGWHGHLCEPIPKFCSIARAHYLDYPGVQVHQIAISNFTGEVDFYVHENESTDLLQMGSSLNRNSLPSQSFSKIKVKVREVNEFLLSCRLNGQIGVISLDTGGNDLRIVKSLDFSIHTPFIFVIEVALGDNEIAKVMRAQNYHFLARSVANEIWISKSSIYLNSFPRKAIFKIVQILFKLRVFRKIVGLMEK